VLVFELRLRLVFELRLLLVFELRLVFELQLVFELRLGLGLGLVGQLFVLVFGLQPLFVFEFLYRRQTVLHP